MKDKIKISVIGAGFVGATTAYTIAMGNLANEIVLVDLNEAKARAEAIDICHGTPFVGNIHISNGDYKGTRDSDIIIVTAGPQPKIGERRLDVLNKGLKINSSIIPEIVKYSPRCIILMVANPLDVLTYQAYKLSGFPKERVIGSGTVIDTSRLKYYLAQKFSLNPKDLSAYILGEHGDSQVAIWSHTTIGGINIEEYLKSFNFDFDEKVKGELLEKVKQVGFDIVNGKGYTSFGIAASVEKIVKAIVRDEEVILPTSTLYNGEYGINDVYMAAPCVIGRDGVKKVVELKLSLEELKGIENSSKVLKEIINSNLNL